MGLILRRQQVDFVVTATERRQPWCSGPLSRALQPISQQRWVPSRGDFQRRRAGWKHQRFEIRQCASWAGDIPPSERLPYPNFPSSVRQIAIRRAMITSSRRSGPRPLDIDARPSWRSAFISTALLAEILLESRCRGLG